MIWLTLNSDREEIAKVARSRDSPSAGAKLNVLQVTQRKTRPDAVYNWRPMSLQPPPISVYHPTFAKFTRLMSMQLEDEEFSHDELQSAFEFIISSLEFYTNEETRQMCLKGIQSIDRNILQQTRIFLTSGNLTPDGYSQSPTPVFPPGSRMAYKAFQHLKAEVGTGSCDPMAQAECAFLAVYSSDEVSHVCVFEGLLFIIFCSINLSEPYHAARHFLLGSLARILAYLVLSLQTTSSRST